MKGLFSQSRTFFSRPSAYKESFKFYPVPGGYMTPFPGTYEVFELRRGLVRCPEELTGQAMATFHLLEGLALRACAVLGCDLGLDLAGMPNEASPTMRCLHYDRPQESRGDADVGEATSKQPAPGAAVRVVGLSGTEAALNGAKATVEAWQDDVATVVVNAPDSVICACGGTRTRSLPSSKLRSILANAPGMYPSHTDSSLVTIAPRSTLAGLEAKDFRTGEWFRIEEDMHEDEVLVFLGDPVDYASAHKYRALMHRPAVHTTVDAHCMAGEHRISTPFFLYPRNSAVLAPPGLPRMVFDDLNGNVNKCRDNFPWKLRSCYYSDLVYSDGAGDSSPQHKAEAG